MRILLIPLLLVGCQTLTPQEEHDLKAMAAMGAIVAGEHAMQSHCPSLIAVQAIRMAADVAAQSQAIAFTMDQLRQRDEARADTDRICGFG